MEKIERDKHHKHFDKKREEAPHALENTMPLNGAAFKISICLRAHRKIFSILNIIH